MPSFYRKHLTQSLSALIEEQTSQTAAEQVALWDELALMKIAAMSVVQLYDCAVSNNVPPALIAEAAYNMRQALKDVADMAERVAKVEAMAADKFSVGNLNLVVHQIVRVCHQVFEKSGPKLGVEQQALETMLTEFNLKIKEQVKLADEHRKLGVTSTPDQNATIAAQVAAMDGTIPDAPEPDELHIEAVSTIADMDDEQRENMFHLHTAMSNQKSRLTSNANKSGIV